MGLEAHGSISTQDLIKIVRVTDYLDRFKFWLITH